MSLGREVNLGPDLLWPGGAWAASTGWPAVPAAGRVAQPCTCRTCPPEGTAADSEERWVPCELGRESRAGSMDTAGPVPICP